MFTNLFLKEETAHWQSFFSSFIFLLEYFQYNKELFQYNSIFDFQINSGYENTKTH